MMFIFDCIKRNFQNRYHIWFVLFFFLLSCGREEKSDEDMGISIEDIKTSSNWKFNDEIGLGDGSYSDEYCNKWEFTHPNSWKLSKLGSFQIKKDGIVVEKSDYGYASDCSDDGKTLSLIFVDKNTQTTILSNISKTYKKFNPVTVQFIYLDGYTWDSSLDCKMYGSIVTKRENKTFSTSADFEKVLKLATCKMEKVNDTKYNCDFGNTGCISESSTCLINRGLTIRCSNYSLYSLLKI